MHRALRMGPGSPFYDMEYIVSKHIEFIPDAGACTVSKNVLSGEGKVRWMVRGKSHAPADNGWQILSDIDTSEYLNDPSNWQIADFNDLCAIEPALIGIWDMPVGSDLELRRHEKGMSIIDSTTGRVIPHEELFVPPQFRD